MWLDNSYVGAGITLVSTLLSFAVKSIPRPIAFAGIVVGVGLMALPSVPDRFFYPMLLGICGAAILVASGFWAWDVRKAPEAQKAGAAQPHRPSLLSLFMTDHAKGDFSISDSAAETEFDTNEGTKRERIFFGNVVQWNANASFLVFYLPENPFTYQLVLHLVDIHQHFLQLPADAVFRKLGGTAETRLSEVPFSKKIVFYHEGVLSQWQLATLTKKFADEGLKVDFLSQEYVEIFWKDLQLGRHQQPADFELRDGFPHKVGAPDAPLFREGEQVLPQANSTFDRRLPIVPRTFQTPKRTDVQTPP